MRDQRSQPKPRGNEVERQPRHLNEISQAMQRELADHGGRMRLDAIRRLFPKNEQSVLQELLDKERTVYGQNIGFQSRYNIYVRIRQSELIIIHLKVVESIE